MTKAKSKKVQEFKITSFCNSGARELIVIDDPQDFLKIIGDGGVMVDCHGSGWAISDLANYHCPRYK